MSTKYYNPSGFPENLPGEQIVEEKLKAIIRDTSESFGYVPLETSAVEYLDTLSSKGEVTKEIYTIGRALDEETSDGDRALRFDLTVPSARYVAQHYNELVFPFKRYQIQRVWRGERPQKGRFREFYQADIDVIANEKLPLACDAEVATVMLRILDRFGIGSFTMHLNNRKVLQGILTGCNISATNAALRIIDKFDKVGREKTEGSLVSECGIDAAIATQVFDLLGEPVALTDVPAWCVALPFSNEVLTEGVAELTAVAALLAAHANVVFNPRIARGLDYYTGSVFETTLDGFEKYGSICSGGRYANLTEKFISRTLPGVGLSIGLTRLLDIIKIEQLLPTNRAGVTDVVVGLANEDVRAEAHALGEELRQAGLNVEVFYSGDVTLGKQAAFAEKRGAKGLVFRQTDGSLLIKTSGGQEKSVSVAQILELCNKK